MKITRISLTVLGLILLSGCVTTDSATRSTTAQLCDFLNPLLWLSTPEEKIIISQELRSRGENCLNNTPIKGPSDKLAKLEKSSQVSTSIKQESKPSRKYQGSPSGCSVQNSNKDWLLGKLDKYGVPQKNRSKKYLNDGNIYSCKFTSRTTTGYMEDYGDYWQFNGLQNTKYEDGGSYFGYVKQSKPDNFGVRWYPDGSSFEGEWIKGLKGPGVYWFEDDKQIAGKTKDYSYKGYTYTINVNWRSFRIAKDNDIARISVTVKVKNTTGYNSYISENINKLSVKEVSSTGNKGASDDLFNITNISWVPVDKAISLVQSKLRAITDAYMHARRQRSPDKICSLKSSEILYSDGQRTNYRSREREIVQFIKFTQNGFLVSRKDWREDDSVDWRSGASYEDPVASGLFCDDGFISISCSGRELNSGDSKKIAYNKINDEFIKELISGSKETTIKTYTCIDAS